MKNMNSRQQHLYEIVRGAGSIPVRELLPEFDVTPATVRKDIARMEKMGLLIHTHGEVHVPVKKQIGHMGEWPEHPASEAKVAIAHEAVRHIKEGESIVLDAGSTALEIAKLLTRYRRLTVITNSIAAATVLAKSSVTVCMTGGLLFGRELALMGPDTEAGFRGIRAAKTFITADGVREGIGFLANQPVEAATKRAMVEAGQEVFVVMDSSKLGMTSIYPFAAFEQADYLITEQNIEDAALRASLEKAHVQILVPGALD